MVHETTPLSLSCLYTQFKCFPAKELWVKEMCLCMYVLCHTALECTVPFFPTHDRDLSFVWHFLLTASTWLLEVCIPYSASLSVCLSVSSLSLPLSLSLSLCKMLVFFPNAGADKRVMVWDFAAGIQLVSFTGHSNTIHQLAFSRDSSILASGEWLCSQLSQRLMHVKAAPGSLAGHQCKHV